MDSKTAKLFVNGGSQAVRLPAEFRFDAEEVYIRRDAVTGDVILSHKPVSSAWADFFAFRDEVALPSDILRERPLNEPLKPRDLRKGR